MEKYIFKYQEVIVDGLTFRMIECKTWPYLNIQVLSTTPDRFDEDVSTVKSRAMCGYIDTDRTFILMHAGGEQHVDITQENYRQVLDGMNAIMRAAVKWWSQNRYKYDNSHTAYWEDVVK